MNDNKYVSPEIEVVLQSVNDIMAASDDDNSTLYEDIGSLWGN